MSQKLDARLLPDSMAIERLSWCCSTRTIGDLRLISDEIVARLAYERALFQPWPYLGQERCRRCRGPLRCLLLVILPAAMTAADLCVRRMGPAGAPAEPAARPPLALRQPSTDPGVAHAVLPGRRIPAEPNQVRGVEPWRLSRGRAGPLRDVPLADQCPRRQLRNRRRSRAG